MAALEAAAARLTTALDKMEQLGRMLAEAKDEVKKQALEISRLNQEHETLLARVTELEEESRALAGITEEVEGRLDGAIEEIRTALGR